MDLLMKVAVFTVIAYLAVSEVLVPQVEVLQMALHGANKARDAEMYHK